MLQIKEWMNLVGSTKRSPEDELKHSSSPSPFAPTRTLV